ENKVLRAQIEKGEGRKRRPDIMFLGNYLEMTFELLYIECSRLFCSSQKKTDDEIKLWQEDAITSEPNNVSNSDVTGNVSNSDVHQESSSQLEVGSSEDKEIENLKNKERVSSEIKQRNREKKLQHKLAKDQSLNLISDTSISFEQNHISKKCQEIFVTNQTKVHFSQKSLGNESPNHNIYMSEEPDEIEPTKITMQRLVHLFQNTIQARHKEILSWYYYSDNFENKVIKICYEIGVTNKTAKTQLYKEMLSHLPGITLGNLCMKTLKAKKIQMLFGKDGVEIEKIKQVTYSIYAISSLTNS
ncbi:21229_t:CDS:2, partial [Gigaspora margarita]